MTEFKVPELGENIASGDVAKVLVSVGDTVKKEQPVIELETDKATIEVPSSVAGVVKEIKVKKGDKVQVGAVIFTVDDGAAAGNGASSSAGKAAPTRPRHPPRPRPKPGRSRRPSRSRNPRPRPGRRPNQTPKPEARAEQKVVSMPPRQPVEAPAGAVARAGSAIEPDARRGLARGAPPGARDWRGHQRRRRQRARPGGFPRKTSRSTPGAS